MTAQKNEAAQSVNVRSVDAVCRQHIVGGAANSVNSMSLDAARCSNT